MFVSIRSALLILAAASASSVAPAQVGPVSSSEPLIPVTTASLPKIVVPEPTSELTYTPEAEIPADTNIDADAEIKPTGDLDGRFELTIDRRGAIEGFQPPEMRFRPGRRQLR